MPQPINEVPLLVRSDDDEFSAALAKLVQDRTASGAWHVIGVTSLRAVPPDLREAVETMFGAVTHGVLVVIEREKDTA